MKIDLSGLNALVTGSTAGIGWAIARGLAEAGASVILNGRDEGRLAAAVERLRRDLPAARISGVAADLSSAKGAAALTLQVPSVDILVNNLGIYRKQPFFDIEDGEWERFFQVNVMSGVRAARHYAQGMRERNWGRILFVSSESGLHIPPEMVHYGMTKAAQLAVARGLAETLAGTNVTVNSLLPGPTHTENTDALRAKAAADRGISLSDLEDEFLRTMRPTSIIRRFTQPEEVAAMAVYLCSRQASATTGAAIRVDGGIVSSIA